MSHPKVDWLGEEDEEPQGRILPVYPLTEGLQQWQMRKIVAETVAAFGHLLEEIFPDEYLQAHNLWPLDRAIQQIHAPDNAEQLAGAGGGWPTRSCSCWGWPWPSGGISSTICGRPRRWRPRPRSMPASAASSLSS